MNNEDCTNLPAFISREQVGDLAIISFNVSSSYEMPVELFTSHISQFQSVLHFASKLLEREKSITDEFTRESLFAEYLKDITSKHADDLLRAEKKSLTELSPLLQKISDIERSTLDAIDAMKCDYEQQIKSLQKAKASVEAESASMKTELEALSLKEIKTYTKRIIDLESDLQKATRGESSIREQCKAESDRLIKAIEDKNKEILRIKDESMQQREQKLLERESEFQLKIKRQSSSVLRGQDGEHFFAKLAKDKMNWTLIKAPTHSCDYSSVVLGIPVLFEIKNYSKPVPEKETTKFIADMKMHPEALVGIFISLNTGITGRNPDVPISLDWIHNSQTLIYIQCCIDLDIDHTLSLIEQCIRVTGILNRSLSQDKETQEPIFQQRIEDTKLYIDRSIANITKLITRIGVDKKNMTTLIESASREHISQLKYLMTDITTVSQTLLGTSCESTSEESLEPVVKPKKSAKKKSSV